MPPLDRLLLRRSRALVNTLREEGRDADAEIVEALISAFADPETPLLTTGAVARHLGVTRQSVVNWVKSGRLAGVRVGGRTLIPAEELRRFAEFDSVRAELESERPAENAETAADTLRHSRAARRSTT